MPYYEFSEKWVWSTAASTGGSTQIATVRGKVERLTFTFQSDSGCTCTVQMQAGPSTSGPWASLMAAANLSTAQFQVQQMAGPVAYLRPYVSAKTTGGLTIEAFGN